MERDRFKESFKYYKSRDPPPDLSNVIEIDEEKNKEVQNIKISFYIEISKKLKQFSGLATTSLMRYNSFESRFNPGNPKM